MSLLHRQIPRFQISSFRPPLSLISLWEKDNSLAFDLSWPCWLHWLNKNSQPNFSGLDLSGRNLQGAWLWNANLYQVNLSRADLSGANLGGTDLRGADLRGTNLYRADLRGADFCGANFFRADLTQTRADFSTADLSGAYRFSNLPSGWKIVNGYLQKE